MKSRSKRFLTLFLCVFLIYTFPSQPYLAAVYSVSKPFEAEKSFVLSTPDGSFSINTNGKQIKVSALFDSKKTVSLTLAEEIYSVAYYNGIFYCVCLPDYQPIPDSTTVGIFQFDFFAEYPGFTLTSIHYSLLLDGADNVLINSGKVHFLNIRNPYGLDVYNLDGTYSGRINCEDPLLQVFSLDSSTIKFIASNDLGFYYFDGKSDFKKISNLRGVFPLSFENGKFTDSTGKAFYLTEKNGSYTILDAIPPSTATPGMATPLPTTPAKKSTSAANTPSDYNMDWQNNLITSQKVGVTVAALKKSLPPSSENINIKNHAGEVKSSGTIGTGSVVSFTYSNKNYSFTLIVKGDLTGTGTSNTKDKTVLMKHMLQETPLRDAFLSAADLNDDSSVNLQDILLLSRDILK